MKITILGVGLIGGSIGMAARRSGCNDVCGYDSSPEALETALKLGAITSSSSDIADAVGDADIVFVATPISALPETISTALNNSPASCVVTDVGSVKRLVSDHKDERFIGGHPLAGAETAGVENARENIFDGEVWYLTPTKDSKKDVFYERLRDLLTGFGARVIAIDPEAHDMMMASVSHLPHLLANLLVTQIAEIAGSPAPSPSFRDATRVAGANSEIWTDIYTSNSEALICSIEKFTELLQKARVMLENGDADEIAVWNEDARRKHEAATAVLDNIES